MNFNEIDISHFIDGQPIIWSNLEIVGEFINKKKFNSNKIDFMNKWILVNNDSEEQEIINSELLEINFSMLGKNISLFTYPYTSLFNYKGNDIIYKLGKIRFNSEIQEILINISKDNVFQILNLSIIDIKNKINNSDNNRLKFIFNKNKLDILENFDSDIYLSISYKDIKDLDFIKEEKIIKIYLHNGNNLEIKLIDINNFEKIYFLIYLWKNYWEFKEEKLQYFIDEGENDDNIYNILLFNNLNHLYLISLKNEKIKKLNEKNNKWSELESYWRNNVNENKVNEVEKDNILKEKDKLIRQLRRKLDELNDKINILLEEKNFYLNNNEIINKIKNEQNDISSLSDIKFNNTTKDVFNNLDLTIIEEERNKNLWDENDNHMYEEKIVYLKKKNKLYKKELQNFKKIYEKENIEKIINEKNELKIKNNALSIEINTYKNNLMKFTFAYQYLNKEFESLKNFKNIMNNIDLKKNDNFILLNEIVNSLTDDIINKKNEIDELKEFIIKINNKHSEELEMKNLEIINLTNILNKNK